MSLKDQGMELTAARLMLSHPYIYKATRQLIRIRLATLLALHWIWKSDTKTLSLAYPFIAKQCNVNQKKTCITTSLNLLIFTDKKKRGNFLKCLVLEIYIVTFHENNSQSSKTRNKLQKMLIDFCSKIGICVEVRYF